MQVGGSHEAPFGGMRAAARAPLPLLSGALLGRPPGRAQGPPPRKQYFA